MRHSPTSAQDPLWPGDVGPGKGASASSGSRRGGGGGSGGRPSRRPRRRFRLNRRALIILLVLVVAAVPTFLLVNYLQVRSSRANLLARAQTAHADGEPVLALRYVNRYLELAPDDVEALDLKAELLSASVRSASGARQALSVNDRLLQLDPDHPDRQTARRRAVRLNLRAGRFATAETIARDLIRRGADDAEAHRLLAETLLTLSQQGSPNVLEEAIDHYRQAQAKEPGNIDGALLLAELYRTEEDDLEAAVRVLDELIAADPTSVPAHLARHRFFVAAEQPEQAQEALEEALRRAPEDADVRVAAAEAALRRGALEAARTHLEAIPPDAQDRLNVRLVRGMLELRENRVEEAITSWQQGLVQTGGTDVELTWRLAFVLLQLGRVSDADPLISQFRRLLGAEEPTPEARYLTALRDLKSGQPAQAAAEMEAIRDRVAAHLRAQLHYSLGQAYEAAGETQRALASYRQASRLEPGLPAPWLSASRLLQAHQPEEAIEELQRAITAIPGEPTLMLNLAHNLWRQQMQRPPAQRNWTAFQRLLAQIQQVAPDASGLALVQADFLIATNQSDEALATLEQATRHHPRQTDLWLARANLLTRLNRGAEALTVLEQAEAAAGDSAELRLARARLLALRHRNAEARAVLTDHITRLPRDQQGRLWQAAGELRLSQQDRAGARAAFAEWARLEPGTPQPREALLDLALLEGDEAEIQKAVEALKDHGPQRWRLARARALLRERPDGPGDADTDPNADARLSEAARLIDEVLADAPDQSRALLLRGLLGQRRDRPEEAIAAFEQALELGASAALGRLVALAIEARRPEVLDRLRQRQPSLAPEIDRRAAEAALRLGRGDEAAQLAEQVRRAAPENLQAHLWHAQILNTLGQPDQAEALLQGLVNQQPENAGGWLLLIAFQANQGQRAEALATVEQMRQQAQFDQPELLLAQAYRLAGDLARADAMFDEALRKWPDDLSVLRAASDFHAVIGRTAQAEAQLRHALELDPQAAWARRRLAQLLSNRPHDHAAWSEALALIGETDRPDDEPDDRLTRGLVLSRGPEPRHRQQAVTLLEELVADLPTAATARERLVRIYLTDKQPEQALEHARVLGTAENASPSAIANYAEVLVAAERPMEEALEQLDRLAEPHRDGLRAAAIEARARYAQGQDDAGDRLLETAFDRVADAPSGPIAAGQVLTLLTDQERFEAAERVGRRVAQRWPERAYLLARVLGASGRVDEGLDLCEQTAEAGAPREAANSAVALAVLHKPTTDARLARAEALLDQARAQFPDDLTLILAQALLRHAQGRYDDEIALYHAVQERGPADYQFLNNLAWTLCEGLGRPEEALEYADEALQRLGWNPNLLDTRGVILFRLGRLDEAIPLLREAADAAPTPTILFHLARALHHNGDHDEARHTLQRAQDAGLTPELLEPHERDELKALDTSLNNGQ